MFNQSQIRWLAVWLLRVALAFSFLSAVADRFGLWGPFGVAGVGWGDFERFTAYTANSCGSCRHPWCRRRPSWRRQQK